MPKIKSSITAEMKLAGLSKFKSELGSVGQAAKKAGKEIASVRPPDITLTPAFQYIQARKRGEQMLTAMTKAEAEKRVRIEEQAAARSAKAMRTVIGGLQLRKMTGPEIARAGGEGRFNHLAGGMYAGGTRGVMGGKGGSGGAGGRFDSAGVGTRNAGIAYNFAQDYIQGGGIRGVANNIPQVAEMVMASPQMKTIGAAALAGIAGYVAYDQISKAYHNFTGQKEERRRTATHLQLQNDYQKYQTGVAIGNASFDAGKTSESMKEEMGYETRQRQFSDFNEQKEDAVRAQQEQNHRDQLSRIEDEEQRIKESSAYEIKLLKEKAELDKSRMAIEFDRASKAKLAANQEYNATKAKIELIEETNRRDGTETSDEERILLAELKGIIEAQRDKSQAADSRYRSAEDWGKQVEKNDALVPEIESSINDKTNEALKKLDEAKSPFSRDKNDAMEAEFRKAKAADQLRRSNEEVAKKKIRDEEDASLTEQESMSRMSPRKLEKYQREKRVNEEKKRLMALGYDPDKAADMAERGEKLSEKAKDADSHPGRIRGAGFGKTRDGRTTGLGTSTFGGLEDLASMQPGADPMAGPAGSTERKRIGGAGRDKSKIAEREGNKETAGVAVWQQIVKGLQAVEKAVRDTDASKQERRKPLSTTAR